MSERGENGGRASGPGWSWPDCLSARSRERIEAALGTDAELKEDVERLLASLDEASRRSFALAFAHRLGRGTSPGRALLAAVQDALADEPGRARAGGLFPTPRRRLR